MKSTSENRSHGFTLVELMIVVAIIGVLSSIAIPSFISYQLSSKRAEAFSNLSAIAKSQKAYFAEFNSFVAVNPEPWFTSGDLPTTIKRDKTPIDAAFATIGWQPDGNVFFDYDTATGENALAGTCLCTEGCFTSSAYGDLDGDALVSIVIYAHPDANGQHCTTGRAAGGAGPWDPPSRNGLLVTDEVVRVTTTLVDDF